MSPKRCCRTYGGFVAVQALVCLALAGLLLALPSNLVGQEVFSTDCDLVSYRMLQSQELGMGQRVTHVGRPVVHCPDGSRIRADTATVYSVPGQSMFEGNVRYDTPRWQLDADRATYLEQDRRLTATGSAVLTNHEDGSVIRGDTLVHFGADDRGDELLTVSGGRPTATLPPQSPPAGEPPGEVVPYEVEGNRLRFEGEALFRAFGAVEVRREELRASSDSLRYEREAGMLVLGGDARLEGEEYDLTGTTLELFLPDDRLSEVRALENGVLTTVDLRLTAPTELRILLEDEQMERLVAVRRVATAEDEEAQPGDPEDLPQAEATTPDFHLKGDSIDAVAPGEVLEMVAATGMARGESRGRVLPGDVEEEYPELARKDWIEGHEIVASFEPHPRLTDAARPVADNDSEEVAQEEAARSRGYRLSGLVARGDARSLYRIEDREEVDPEATEPSPEEGAGDEEDEVEVTQEEDAPGPPSSPERRWGISYLLADEIRIVMTEGEVDRMEAEGNVRGIHLEPRRRTAVTGADGAGGSGSGEGRDR